MFVLLSILIEIFSFSSSLELSSLTNCFFIFEVIFNEVAKLLLILDLLLSSLIILLFI